MKVSHFVTSSAILLTCFACNSVMAVSALFNPQRSLSEYGVLNHLGAAEKHTLAELSEGKPLIIYFWSLEDTSSLNELKSFSEAKPDKCKLSAVCLLNNEAGVVGKARQTFAQVFNGQPESVISLYDVESRLAKTFPGIQAKSGGVFVLHTGCSNSGLRVARLTNSLADCVGAALEEDSKQVVAQVVAVPEVTVSDVGGDPFSDEIIHLVDHLKLSAPADGIFKPSASIKAGDFYSLLVKAAKLYPDRFVEPPAPQGKMTDTLTRSRAVLLLSRSLKEWAEIDKIMSDIQNSAGKRYFDDESLSGCEGVKKWGEKEYSLALYSGVLPDKSELRPDDDCSRAYAAALVSRAIPEGSGFTGLAINLCGKNVGSPSSLIIAPKSNPSEVLFPISPERTPSMPFLDSPGLVSVNPDLQVIKARRVGANPLVVEALELGICPRGLSVLVSDEDAELIRKLSKASLVLHTWKVGLFNYQSKRTVRM